jgi:hypothetical protein
MNCGETEDREVVCSGLGSMRLRASTVRPNVTKIIGKWETVGYEGVWGHRRNSWIIPLVTLSASGIQS